MLEIGIYTLHKNFLWEQVNQPYPRCILNANFLPKLSHILTTINYKFESTFLLQEPYILKVLNKQYILSTKIHV